MNQDSNRRIVGIVLAHNEEWTIRWVMGNILKFCDALYLFDHQSADRTPDYMQAFAAHHETVHFKSISQAAESHQCLEAYADTATWVFGVDGDEIYDPSVLDKLRPRLLSGEFDRYFKITANCVHVESVNVREHLVSGYACPPAKAITKLYNFNAIKYWKEVPNERLHGGVLKFKEGYSDDARLHFWKDHDWDDTPMRCLHLCFHSRSPADIPGIKSRHNISDLVAHKEKKRALWKHLAHAISGKAKDLPMFSPWKEDQYRQGAQVEVSLAPFYQKASDPFLRGCLKNAE